MTPGILAGPAQPPCNKPAAQVHDARMACSMTSCSCWCKHVNMPSAPRPSRQTMPSQPRLLCLLAEVALMVLGSSVRIQAGSWLRKGTLTCPASSFDRPRKERPAARSRTALALWGGDCPRLMSSFSGSIRWRPEEQHQNLHPGRTWISLTFSKHSLSCSSIPAPQCRTEESINVERRAS